MSACHQPYPRLLDSGGELFAAPKRGLALDDCWFYHTIDLPGHGTIKGCWDLRAGIGDYTGRLDYRGKRVLEFGTASGCVCFALEQRGAEVVAFDLAPGAEWDIVPLARHPDLEGQRRQRQRQLERLRNSYWFGHEATKSRAQVVHGHIYEVPEVIGKVDVALYGCILLHLRDPLMALANGARLARQFVVVTDYLHEPWVPFLPPRSAEARFWPRARRKLCAWLLRRLEPLTPYADQVPKMTLLPDSHNLDNCDTWWALSPALVQRFLGILGFERGQVYRHRQWFEGRPATMFTVVAERTQPLA